MKKLWLLLCFVLALGLKSSLAQVVDAPPGVTPGTGSFSYIQHSEFAWSFTQTSTGYQAKTYFTCDPGVVMELGLSITALDKDGNDIYNNTIQYIPAQAWNVPLVIDIPGFDWNNCSFLLIEWSAWHRDANGHYDEIWDDVAYEYHF